MSSGLRQNQLLNKDRPVRKIVMLLIITEVLRLDINIVEFREQGLAVVQSIRSNGSSDEDPFPKASGQDQIPILCEHRAPLCPGLREPDGYNHHYSSDRHS